MSVFWYLIGIGVLATTIAFVNLIFSLTADPTPIAPETYIPSTIFGFIIGGFLLSISFLFRRDWESLK
jgi:hypothetical protein